MTHRRLRLLVAGIGPVLLSFHKVGALVELAEKRRICR